ncbi:MAG: hypothetical protein B6245_19475, partial [Desulfobacteraceae bacterium 4572_88]
MVVNSIYFLIFIHIRNPVALNEKIMLFFWKGDFPNSVTKIILFSLCGIFYSKRIPPGKETGNTDNTESPDCRMRQRISRPVRETLSFSGKKTDHVGA